ncbi:phosphohydrolase [Thermosyntropha sp.]|uniref:phosphohydrolase n=1 Tax=Thermosyntropha sp. TaxID=2740820 RepID=UPI0026000BAA|nr:phosphohydrolase [Thermosyntropha sp.]MBO8158878.1 phosphohydrolase [Thermosyntropha sp.]
MITLERVKESRVLKQYMISGNQYIGNIGAIEHNMKHAEWTANLCRDILFKVGADEREAELGAIAGYLHDVGNLVNRYGHGLSGAMIAFYVLLELGMDYGEIATIMGAIGNHEEQAKGSSVNRVAAALILADKSDVHRSRVRKRDKSAFTQRDRVNFAVTRSYIKVENDKGLISLIMRIDAEVCSVMEYFEIFLTKMMMCRRAANYLGYEFALVINNHRLL